MCEPLHGSRHYLLISAHVKLQTFCFFVSFLSSGETRGAALQWPLLQGRLCCCPSALSEARRPSPPAGTPPHSQEMNHYETLRCNSWIVNLLIVPAAVCFCLFRVKKRHISTLVHTCLSEQDGKIDMSFFTHDCFHFTIKGHEELAKGVWNNMVNTESRKQKTKVQQSTDQHCFHLFSQTGNT